MARSHTGREFHIGSGLGIGAVCTSGEKVDAVRTEVVGKHIAAVAGEVHRVKVGLVLTFGIRTLSAEGHCLATSQGTALLHREHGDIAAHIVGGVEAASVGGKGNVAGGTAMGETGSAEGERGNCGIEPQVAGHGTHPLVLVDAIDMAAVGREAEERGVGHARSLAEERGDTGGLIETVYFQAGIIGTAITADEEEKGGEDGHG